MRARLGFCAFHDFFVLYQSNAIAVCANRLANDSKLGARKKSVGLFNWYLYLGDYLVELHNVWVV